jgi:hypothetical protein
MQLKQPFLTNPRFKQRENRTFLRMVTRATVSCILIETGWSDGPERPMTKRKE